MTNETTKALYEKIMQTPEIQQEILEVLTTMKETNEAPDWGKLAANWGFSDVTEEDILEYGDTLTSDDYELTDFELEMVSAASSTQCGNLGT